MHCGAALHDKLKRRLGACPECSNGFFNPHAAAIPRQRHRVFMLGVLAVGNVLVDGDPAATRHRMGGHRDNAAIDQLGLAFCQAAVTQRPSQVDQILLGILAERAVFGAVLEQTGERAERRSHDVTRHVVHRLIRLVADQDSLVGVENQQADRKVIERVGKLLGGIVAVAHEVSQDTRKCHRAGDPDREGEFRQGVCGCGHRGVRDNFAGAGRIDLLNDDGQREKRDSACFFAPALAREGQIEAATPNSTPRPTAAMVEKMEPAPATPGNSIARIAIW